MKEKDVSTNKLITRWSLDAIERYIKISSDPFTLHIIFDVMRRNDRNRKYIMEYADAQVNCLCFIVYTSLYLNLKNTF